MANQRILKRNKGKENYKNESVLADELLVRQSESFIQHEAKNYFSFLIRVLRKSDSYRAYEKFNSRLKPFFFIYRILKVLFIAIAWIQASAMLLILLLIALIIFPVALMLLFILAFFARINAKYENVKISRLIENKRVLVFFRRQGFSRFFCEHLKELSKSYTVIVIIPRPIKIFEEKRPLFLNCEKAGDNIIVLYEHYFFEVRRKFLSKSTSVFYVY